MSRIQEQPATIRADRPARRPRRSAALSLTMLEDRRLMTAGVATTAIAPAAVQAVPTVATRMIAAAPGSLAVAGDSGPADGWIYAGSEAQFGPTGPYVLYGGGNAWPTPPPGSSPDAPPEQAKLDAAFAKQSADMQAIQDRSEVTPRLLASLRTARADVADQAGEPDASLLKAFQDDARKVQESGTFTDAQQGQLKDEYTAVLKSAGVSDDAVAALFAAQDAVKAASHVTPDDVALLAADQEAVQALLDAMPQHDAVAFAAADAAGGSAGGAPMTLHGGTAMIANEGATTTAVPVSAAGTMLAGAAVDPATDPATLAATSAPVTLAAPEPVATTSAPITTTAVPVATTAAPSPNHTLYARALNMARGTAPVGGLLPRALGSAQWSTTTSTPIARADASNATPLDAAIKRLTTRSANNVRRGPAIRHRLAFAGSMRRPGNF